MKLVKCYVSSFGKLQNFTYDFCAELNTIKEDNGWGKSTLATFIKAMFYGLNDSKRSVSENERIKFRPWGDSGKFGGYVQFIWGDKEYKIERYFGAKESEDTVALYDVASGKLFKNTDNLGKRIFEIDEEGFLSTTYFAQKDFQAKSNTSLTAKFNSVCEVQDTQAYDKAVLKLEEKAKTYKYRGDKGLIADAKREVYFINDELDRANRAVATVKTLKEEEIELKKQVEALKERTSQLTQRVVDAGKTEALVVKKQSYDKLVKEKLTIEHNIKTAEDIFNGNKITEFDVEIKTQELQKIRSLSERENALENDINLLKNSLENKCESSINASSILLCVFTMTFLVASIICFIAKVGVVAWVTLGVAVVLLFAFICKTFVFDKKLKNTKSPYGEMLIIKSQELEKIKQEKIDIERGLNDFINLFNFGEKLDCFTALSHLSKIVRVYNELQNKKAEIDKEIKEIGWNNDLSENIEKVENLAQLNEELNAVQIEYSKMTAQLSNKRSAINMHEQLANSYTELESKKAELTQKIATYNNEYDILTKTVKFLKQADENLKIKYRAPLQESLKKYFSYVDNAEKDVNIDVDLKVTVGERSGQKATDYYSKGYQNLFEICKRFALTDVLFTGEKPFMILDDPFYNLDDKKIKQAVELLKKLSKDYQIIYLICHESRRA